jgi:hypothetical protein
VAWFEDPNDHPTPYQVGGLVTRLAEVADTRELVFREEQEVEHHLEVAKHYRNWHPRNGYNLSRTRKYVATIPVIVVNMLIRRGMNPFVDTAAFKKWLNSDEAKPWRTSSGEV